MVLQKLIFPPSALVPNRDIHDNISVTHEILNTFKDVQRGLYGYQTRHEKST